MNPHHSKLYIIAGWWFQPLWKILVSWDYSQYMEKHVPNHKPVIHCSIAILCNRKLSKGGPTLQITPANLCELSMWTTSSLVSRRNKTWIHGLFVMENGPVEIVDLPIKHLFFFHSFVVNQQFASLRKFVDLVIKTMVMFHSYVNVYQRIIWLTPSVLAASAWDYPLHSKVIIRG